MMSHTITRALNAARAFIQQDRTALADAHMGPDNALDADGAAGVAEYDQALALIDAAMAEADDLSLQLQDERRQHEITRGDLERTRLVRDELMREPATEAEVRAKASAEDPGGEDLCRWSFERGWRAAEDTHRITP